MSESSDNVKVNAQPTSPEARSEDTYSPLVDIYEEADGTTVLVAEVPGAQSGSIDLRVDKGVLTVAADGTGEEPAGNYARTYTGFVRGRYFRAFALSDEVDRESIQANLDHGVLTIRLPRAAAAKTRKIEIQ
jgi:HSP20 family protein